MLYSKNSTENIDENLFKFPTSEYRAAPFWAWNCKLNKELLNRQIDYLKEMGFGGFHIHSRTGMSTKYLSEEFMELVKGCVCKAENNKMLTWLYDEDRWPSGFAGGLVTKNPEYRQRKILFTTKKMDDSVSLDEAISNGKPGRIASFEIKLNKDGTLKEYNLIDFEDKCNGKKWYIYMTTMEDNDWYNGQAYIDTLSEEAVQEFIKITYERYYNALGDKFGNTVPAMFTDEPQFSEKEVLCFPEDENDILLPWTPKFAQSFKEEYGDDIIFHLPELIWDLPNGEISVHRYHYHDHLCDLFAKNYAGQCGKWCKEHNLYLTGHMMEEPSLKSQTTMIGEAMRSYIHFQIPGIDMLCGRTELTTAKQAQSVVHQMGYEAMSSELYGVTGWDLDFRGHKFQGDWQAALGVTVRVPHLSWVSMEGGAKRDYPASINYQSPWYKEYSYIENHFARINTVMTRGKAIVDVAIIHPIESYWLHWGPSFTTADVRNQMDERFLSLTQWMINGCVDFDYISESLLPQMCFDSAPLSVGKMTYKTIIIPACETLRRTTLEKLKLFYENGGNLIFLGNPPKYIDAVLSDEGKELYGKSMYIDFEKTALLNALQDVRRIEIHNSNGERADNLIYQLRQDTNCKWLFITHSKECENKDIAGDYPQEILIKIMGEYHPVLWNTLTGYKEEIEYNCENGETVVKTSIYDYDSLLIQLNKSEYLCEKMAKNVQDKIFEKPVLGKVNYKRQEMNVLLLDKAEYSLDGEAFNEEEEIIRIEYICRKKANLTKSCKQPWVIGEKEPEHIIELRYIINSETDIADTYLAIENAQNTHIELNGKHIESVIDGYYVDESIKKVKLGNISKGTNILKLKVPYGERNGVEACYLLGEFDVYVAGGCTMLTPMQNHICFGDVSKQGLAFYGGNIEYTFEMEIPAGDVNVHIGHYRGAVIRVELDGKESGIIALPPYNYTFKNVGKGTHFFKIILYGNRFNTFGSLHDIERTKWTGGNAWRTVKDSWTYGYLLRETGVLSEPIVTVTKISKSNISTEEDSDE